jgi:two-component system, response regulator PdtaR
MKVDGKIKRVLIVEDEMIQALVLESMFVKCGISVAGKVRKGKNAIIKANELVPDLITMDINLLDNIDGITAAIQIQKTNPIPIIYVTGNTDQHNRDRASTTFFIDMLTKPLSLNKLIDAIRKAEKIIIEEVRNKTGS